MKNLSKKYNNFFSFCDSDNYTIPPVGSVESYKLFVLDLPSNDDPEVFGMHENADITYQAQETQKILKTVKSINPEIQTG